MKSFETYPAELECLEAKVIRRRREIVDHPALEPMGPEISTESTAVGANKSPAPTKAAAPAPPDSLPADTIGLALSGGGIRSATFCLGVLQSLSRRGFLRHVDILSTVSGGGYIGSFLGRFYDRLRASPALAPDVVESALSNSASAPIRWLREHGQYIAPAGKSDLQTGFAIFLRNFLTLHLVLGLLGFALYGLVNTVRYAVADPVVSLLPFLATLHWSQLPLGSVVAAADLSVLWSPWFMVVELCLLLRILPLALAYWLASQDEDEAYSRPTLTFAFLALLVLLGIGFLNGVNVVAVLGAGAVLMAFFDVEMAWRRVRKETRAVGSGGARVKQLRARTHLSRTLGVWLVLGGALLYFAIVDTFGHGLFEGYGRGNKAFLQTFAWMGGALVGFLPILRGLAQLLAERSSKSQTPGGLIRLLTRPSVSAVLAVILIAPPILLISYVSHAAFGNGSAIGRGFLASLVALVFSLIFAFPWATILINRSSLQSTYAARIARAFMGASNPNRPGSAADDVLPGDDVDNFTDYRPHDAGGPLHLINVCINQTVDEDTLRSARGRLGATMACSPLGVSIGKFYHARWNRDYRSPTAQKVRRRRTPPPEKDRPLEVIGHVPGTAHPLLGADGNPPDDIEMLPLRDWIAISGAAFGPGQGTGTNPVAALLFLLANLRLGYWWNSGLTAGDRGARPELPFLGRLLWLLPSIFETQSRLLAEATAQFRGPWDRLWYLSDGGHYEGLGGYELIRRRVPYLVILDATIDFGDFARFERMMRIDFRVEIAPVGRDEWNAVVADDVRSIINPTMKQAAKVAWDALAEKISLESGDGGPIDGINASPDAEPGLVKKHAALLKINYASGKPSYLLYMLASMSGDEPPDLIQYRAGNPTFPNQSTENQFFDEPQWESYRRLGEHVGDGALGPLPKLSSTMTKRGDFWLTKFGHETESSQTT